MSYILEGLYLGDMDAASNSEDLRERKGVTHILTIERRPLARALRQGFTCLHIHALDLNDFDLLSHFDDCIAFIDEGRRGGLPPAEPAEGGDQIDGGETRGGVLVHCVAGQSRSATVVLAYVMRALELCAQDALALVHRQRPCVGPNEGFLAQLELYGAMGCRLDGANQAFRLHRLRAHSRHRLTEQSTGDIPTGYLSADPFASFPAQSGVAVYKCKKCRRALFRADAAMSHATGLGEAAFRGHMSVKKAPDSLQTEACRASLFIEPVEWMRTSILDLSGKLGCPKCSAKVGTFNWAGDRCCCGTWVTPAFHIQTSKVDHCQVLPRPADSTPHPVTASIPCPIPAPTPHSIPAPTSHSIPAPTSHSIPTPRSETVSVIGS